MKKSTCILAMIAATVHAPSALADPFTFETLPFNGQVSALPGETAGWGYRIQNPTANWLELTNLSSGVFFDGTAMALFDFPILAAGEERIVTWTAGMAGLFEFTWDISAALNSSNSGLFVVEGVFWDVDPLSGSANIIGQADLQSASYLVTAAPIPEPDAFWLLAAAVAMLWIMRRRSFARRGRLAQPRWLGLN